MSAIITLDQTPEFFFQERCHIAELLNTTDCPGLSIARARVEPGVTTVLHIVRGTEEVFFILSGQGDVEIAGKVIGTVRPGDLLRIPADTPQRITNTGQEDLVFLAVCAPLFKGELYEEVDQA
jgi:mannose-6-phosphate isomerase-like protein (cupin superfamily)